ncbi:MAG: hypothetical protein ONB13_03775 [candidate division KSB1 bacterium]|nr:hypothetical protein [candidate division KSB1 bacterium]MDZ7358435.1 hypothetical protein [candidate division KSB1 bacterium]MDZ7375719.1 hypothetical protein [candidate division KSB1 bacterium]MDZ7401730.1 hypothetical protein [candidate division KSB1 bacterium]
MENNYDLLFYPNRFNITTNLSFQLIKDVSITLKVLNIQGELANE